MMKGVVTTIICLSVMMFFLLVLSSSALPSPKIVNLYSLGDWSDPRAYYRYQLIVGSGLVKNTTVPNLKALNPSLQITHYITTEEINAALPFMDGTSSILQIDQNWWLLTAGTTLSLNIDATTTNIRVLNATSFSASNVLLIDAESMTIVSVDTSSNTLTVTRGINSNATSHTAGAHVAQHAGFWPGTWMLNPSVYCGLNPSGVTWSQYLSQQIVKQIGITGEDGVFYDNAPIEVSWVNGGQVDANRDNIPDGGDGPSGTGWRDGERNLLNMTKGRLPAGKVILTNSDVSWANNLTNGRFFELWPSIDGEDNIVGALLDYLSVTIGDPSSGNYLPYTIVGRDTSDTGVRNITDMRFHLCLSLLGNGYFSYDYGDKYHGNMWWYDEYDNGTGSSLVAAASDTDTIITIYSGSQSKFKVGDYIFVTGDHSVEIMQITQINSNQLTVLRGQNNTQAIAHVVTDKLFTSLQMQSGLGWLGEPLGNPTTDPFTTPNAIVNSGFENGLTGWNFAAYEPTEQVNISIDTKVFYSGSASARLDIIQPNTYKWGNWLGYVVNATAGKTYTLSFYAKSNNYQPIAMLIMTQPAYQTITWENANSGIFWRKFSFVYTSNTTQQLTVGLTVNYPRGSLWVDQFSFNEGDDNLWRREYQNGYVIANAKTVAMTGVTIPAGFSKIRGTQDPYFNNGAAVTTINLPANSAALLVRTTGNSGGVSNSPVSAGSSLVSAIPASNSHIPSGSNAPGASSGMPSSTTIPTSPSTNGGSSDSNPSTSSAVDGSGSGSGADSTNNNNIGTGGCVNSFGANWLQYLNQFGLL